MHAQVYDTANSCEAQAQRSVALRQRRSDNSNGTLCVEVTS